MHFPWWHVTHATAPMLIAVIAVVHVLVSHYAVGGGLFLAVETAYAYRAKNRQYLDYLYQHARFFILVTVVFGAITGVGIWWTIGLASPLATAVLIQTFVFGWATEWVFFVIELVSAFVFYYYWGRLSEKVHVAVGWIYGIAAWISLVLITGITAFMLHPGKWLETGSFWSGFFNPQLLPQVVARTGGALLLTSLYVCLHVASVKQGIGLRELVQQRMSRPALLGSVLITVGGAAWFAMLPESARAAVFAAPVLNILMALVLVLTIIVFAMIYLGPYRNAGWLTPGFAAALCLFGIAAFSTGEFIREAVRKPYVVYNVVLGNQILARQATNVRSQGYLESGVWTKAYVRRNYPQVFSGRSIDGRKLLDLDHADQAALGKVLFMHHCNNCHAMDHGYSPVAPLLRGYSPQMIRHLVEHLEQVKFTMPPWCGSPEEAELLAKYLEELALPYPGGMIPTSAPPETR